MYTIIKQVITKKQHWTLRYIEPCIVFYLYDHAFVTFFIKGYLKVAVQGLNSCLEIMLPTTLCNVCEQRTRTNAHDM